MTTIKDGTGMSARFEEIDWQPTALGEIGLRRWKDPATDTDVYEIKLDDDFLMSSMFTAGEIALARLAPAASPGADLDIAVGGLGLGYTAARVLEDPRVRSLITVETLIIIFGPDARYVSCVPDPSSRGFIRCDGTMSRHVV